MAVLFSSLKQSTFSFHLQIVRLYLLLFIGVIIIIACTLGVKPFLLNSEILLLYLLHPGFYLFKASHTSNPYLTQRSRKGTEAWWDEQVFKVTERVGTHRISLARGGKKVVSCDYSEVRCLFNCTYKTI